MKPLLLLSLAAMAASAQHTKLVIVDPGHFHASLLQKEMYPDLDPRVSVYAPLGPELIDYLNRVSAFNHRPANPTRWELDVHASEHSFDEMLRDRAGNIVVFSGRNGGKIDRILASLSAGLHVLADKPWIITPADLPKLEQALDLAASKGLAAYDIMTERYEVTSQLQRELVNTPALFGRITAIRARSVHHVMKTVAGLPLRRPAWFFDIAQYGDGLGDVGTHPVDLIQWIALPDQLIDYRRDIRVTSSRHESLHITPDQFLKVSGTATSAPLDWDCNRYLEYTLRGVPVKLDVLWKWEAATGTGDVYEASFRGTRATVEIRQGPAEKFVPEIYVLNADPAQLDSAIRRLQSRWPGLAVERTATEARIVIPEKYRVGHEEHFGQVAARFLQYVRDPKFVPAWERSYMLAKYYVTTSR